MNMRDPNEEERIRTIKLEKLRVKWRRDRFVIRIMVGLKIRVRKRCLHSDSFLRIKGLRRKSNHVSQSKDPGEPQNTYQGFSQKVDSERVSIGEELCEWSAFSEGQSADIIARPPGGDCVEFVQSRCAEDIENECQLVVVISSWE